VVNHAELPHERTSTDIGPIDSVFGFHMQRASFVFSPNAKSTRGFPRWELTILSVVSANPGISQSAVSRALGIDQGNLIPHLTGFIKRGLLTKAVPVDDRRVRSLKLTAAGETRLNQVMSVVRKLEAQRLVGFSETERKTLRDLLRRVHAPPGPSNPLVVRALRRGVNAK
jgi:DNA-binding MarR family transcriptional regulator